MAYRMSTRRKLAIATWGNPKEGMIYGKLVIDAAPAVAYIDDFRERTGERLTITHLVTKAVALGLREAPGLNGTVRLGSFVPFETVDLSLLVTLDGGRDLAKVKIDRCDEKPLVELCSETRAGASKLRDGKDKEFEKSKPLLRALPTWLLRPLLKLTGFLASSMGWSIPALGVTRFPFGAGVVSSIGMLGIDEGFIPPTPWCRVPLYIGVGRIHDAAQVVDGEVVVGAQLILTASLDHRFVDGADAGALAGTLRRYLAAPWVAEGDPAPAAFA